MDYFTFLGTGNNGYKEICYEYDGDLLNTKFVQQIILRSFKDKIDRIVVFCTDKSFSVNGEALNNTLRNEKPDINIEYLKIEENISSTDFIDKLIEQIKSDEIIIDVTHIYRHIPMKMMFMIKYIEKSKDIRISHLFYGKLNGEEGELIDCIDDYHTQELTEALLLFDKTLYLSPETIENFADKDKRIEGLLKTMGSLNAHLETCSYDDAVSACKKILEHCNVIKKNAKQYAVLLPFTEVIRNKFDSINVSNKYLSGVNLIRILLKNHKLQTAITFADNLFRTSLIEKSTVNPNSILIGPNSGRLLFDYSQELIYGKYGYHCSKGDDSRSKKLPGIYLNQTLVQYLFDNQVITDFYRVIRNNVNHGGKAVLSDSEETTEKLLQIIETMEQLVRE